MCSGLSSIQTPNSYCSTHCHHASVVPVSCESTPALGWGRGARCVCACCMWCVHVSGVHTCEGQRPRLGVLSLSPLYVWDGAFHGTWSSWVQLPLASKRLRSTHFHVPCPSFWNTQSYNDFSWVWGSELHLPTPQPTFCLVSLSWKVWQ